MSTDLFGEAAGPRHRSGSNRARVKALKAEHGIWTNNIKGSSNWLAFCPARCHEALAGYLDADELADPMSMFAGYCRLIEESGLLVDGCQTELEACLELIAKGATQLTAKD